MFKFATHDELYLAIMQVFGQANERLVTALTFEEVEAGLRAVGWYDPVVDDRLDNALEQLRGWGLLERNHNHAAHYATAAEYERKNLQYALTKRGEAAFAGVEHALYLLSSSGALQTAVLDAIAAQLDELHVLLADPGSANRRIYATLASLESHLDALRTNTKQFNSELQRLLRDEALDLSTFDEVKQATVAYLEEFIEGLDHRKQSIAAGVGRVENVGVGLLHARALNGADLPSLPGNADPAPQWLAQREARWAGLRHWFRPADGAPAAIETLRDIARRAIVSLLRVLERYSEARRHAAGTVQDFRALARWFTACSTDEDAHRLFNAAFGMWPARHAHLAAEDSDEISASTPWADAPTVPVSPLLRTYGRIEKAARTGKVRDTAALRLRRRAMALAERAKIEEAWARLATDGVVRLSQLGRLDHATFTGLLQMIGRALSTRPGTDGRRRAVTSDGQMEIILMDVRDGATATLVTTYGTFHGPDYAIAISSRYRQSQNRAVAT
jgi:uncharacterized protein (TIGR02677 family)